MAQTEARAWWAEVQHLRDAAERTDEARRRADQAELAARPAARRHVEPDPGPPRRRAEDAVVPARRGDHDEDAAVAPRRGDHADGAATSIRRREHAPGSALPARRTVEIRGRTIPAPAVPPRSIEIDRRRPPRRAIERVGPRPDRMAMWALLMGVLLILVAIGTADAGTFAP